MLQSPTANSLRQTTQPEGGPSPTRHAEVLSARYVDSCCGDEPPSSMPVLHISCTSNDALATALPAGQSGSGSGSTRLSVRGGCFGGPPGLHGPWARAGCCTSDTANNAKSVHMCVICVDFCRRSLARFNKKKKGRWVLSHKTGGRRSRGSQAGGWRRVSNVDCGFWFCVCFCDCLFLVLASRIVVVQSTS